ncbi:MAG: hypothetical protein HYX53_05385 [Chloroflexi bacterium]|nr:hypothetical protein [Chloroflexota bacterium]
MRRFLRRQATYFVWGFAIALAIIVAWQVGVSDLLMYAAYSAIVGVIVSGAMFYLERRFPDAPNT